MGGVCSSAPAQAALDEWVLADPKRRIAWLRVRGLGPGARAYMYEEILRNIALRAAQGVLEESVDLEIWNYGRLLCSVAIVVEDKDLKLVQLTPGFSVAHAPVGWHADGSGRWLVSSATV